MSLVSTAPLVFMLIRARGLLIGRALIPTRPIRKRRDRIHKDHIFKRTETCCRSTDNSRFISLYFTVIKHHVSSPLRDPHCRSRRDGPQRDMRSHATPKVPNPSSASVDTRYILRTDYALKPYAKLVSDAQKSWMEVATDGKELASRMAIPFIWRASRCCLIDRRSDNQPSPPV